MNTLHAGLMCTLLLVGTIAGLFGCMSAVRCRRRLAFAVCLAIASLDFAPLAVLLSRLPESETLSPVPWTAAALSLTALSLFASFTLWHKSRRQLSPISVKESCDHLPSALCFAWENGLPCLKNLKMDELSHLLTGEALLNANDFWKTVEPQPIVTLENGQTWSFERVRLGMSGKTVYQIYRHKYHRGSAAPTGTGKGQSSPESHEPAASAIWAGRAGGDAGKGDPARQDPRSRPDRPRAPADPAASVRNAGRRGKRLRRMAAECPAAAGEICG